MRLSAFIRDRLPDLGTFILVVAVADVVLLASGSEGNIILLVDGILLLGGILRLVISFSRDREFWAGVDAVGRASFSSDEDIDDDGGVADEGSALVAARTLPEPVSRQAVSVRCAMDNVARDAAEQVAAARRDADEHREYVETWVHEIKTPIAASRLTIANHPGPGTAAVATEIDRIDAYVDQALYYARSFSVDRDYVIRETSLATMVNDAVKAHARTLIERGVRITIGDGEHGIDEQVFCDAKWMRFCLGQVIENAVKYTAAGDAARDAADDAAGDDRRVPEISFSASHEGEGSADERVILSIRDNGRGIPEQDIPRLFDKGFVGSNGRDPDATRSTGIGLYLVRRLCDKMGLGVDVSSAVGRWTEVRFTFPINRMHFLDPDSRR